METDIEKMAENTADIKDRLVYRGFVDETLDPGIDYDYSEQTLVMLAPLGSFQGSTPDGQTTEEIVDYTALRLMSMQTDEILLDKDHASMRPIDQRDTTAYGWIGNLKAVIGAGDMDGLYGTIRWTPEGIRLAKERVYRFLSPVFGLSQDGHVQKLVNVALTNRPNLKMPPILNTEKTDETVSITAQENEMSKEEIIELVKTTVDQALNSCKTTENAEPQQEEKPAEEKPAEQTEEKQEEKPVEKTEEKQEEKPEPVAEEKPAEEVEKEVVSKDALNSQPDVAPTYDPTGKSEWENLHGQAFFDWLEKHPDCR